MANLTQLRGEDRAFLSPSQITLYEQCALKWKFRYIIKPPQIIRTNPENAFGSAIHYALDCDIKYHLANGEWLLPSTMYALWFEQMLKECDAMEMPLPAATALIMEHSTEARKIIALFIDDVRPLLRPLASELDVALDLGDIEVRGKLDLLSGTWENPVIFDWKISASKRPLDVHGWVAGKVYGAALYQQRGVLPYLQLVRIRRLKREPKLEFSESIPMTLEMVEDIKTFARATADNILLDNFAATGVGSPLCKGWCDYRDLCEPFQEWLAQQPQEAESENDREVDEV